MDLAEKSYLFFYFDLVPNNVYLSHGNPDETRWIHEFSSSHISTDFKVCLGNMNESFTVDPSTRLLTQICQKNLINNDEEENKVKDENITSFHYL